MLTDLGLKPRRLTAQAEAVAACGGLKPFSAQACSATISAIQICKLLVTLRRGFSPAASDTPPSSVS